MKLTALTESLPYCLWQGTMEKDVTALIYFSEEAVPGSLFFAVPGLEHDGCDYVHAAAARGAEVLVTERLCEAVLDSAAGRLPDDMTVLLVDDVRAAMAAMSGAFYGWPLRQLMTVGVTGTKGKTSTAFMIQKILETDGIRTGIIGTVQNGFAGHFTSAERTTPESCDIQRWCREMVDGGCRAVVMEVSSQGLKLGRVDGILFDVAVFTNLSPDHIGRGEHGDFEEYKYWKSVLFTRCRKALLNRDDPYWKDMIPGAACMERTDADLERAEAGSDTAASDGSAAAGPPEIFTFGSGPEADYRIEHLRLLADGSGGSLGTAFQLCGYDLHMELPGRFNAFNGTAAAAAARLLGASWDAVRKGLKLVRVPGRVDPVEPGRPFTVRVDYAPTGVALRSLLPDLRAYVPGRLAVVFGCGGGRDKNRRREMGQAAAALADFIIVTSDNPRKEDPMEIIGDITAAIDQAGGAYQVIQDREAAIRYAMDHGEKDDIILIAGKGHETYQLIGERKIHFDDRETVRKIALEMQAAAALPESGEQGIKR